MKYIAEHYGPALVAFAIMIALAVLMVGLTQDGGFVEQQFQNAFSGFFTRMNGISGITS